jgi:hypothetical protein
MGGNSGNLLYAHSVHRALSIPENEVKAGGFMAHTLDDPSEWIAKVNKQYDQYVIPMSNAFRFGFSTQLTKMTEIVRGLDMPVTVVGVGAQAGVPAHEDEGFVMGKTGSSWRPDPEDVKAHDRVVFDFVSAVLEKSVSFGVRGEYTKRYLEALGLDGDRIDVIGCPSLFTWGADLKIKRRTRRITRRSAISMNVDYRVDGIGAVVEHNTARYRRMTSPSQDSRSARMIIRGEDQYTMTNRDPRTPIHTGHPLFTEKRLLFYPNPWGWIESFKKIDFAFGNRLHGNIAAILGGAPAHLLAHDSRTTELAEYHGIPHSFLADYTTPPSAAELHKKTDYSEFNKLHPQRFQTYLDFLHRNKFTTVFDRGQNAAEFDKRIKKGRQTGPVSPR